MKQKRKKLGRKLIGFLLTLAMVVGLMPGMGLTAYAETTEYDNYFVEVENLNQNCVSAGICSMTEGLYCKGLSADVAKAACNYLKSKTGSKVAVVYGFAVNTRKSNWSKIYIMVDGSPVTNYYGDAPIKSIIGDDCKLFYVKSDAPDFETVSATVTFKVLNGQWDDGTTEDVTVILGGLKDTVYLASDQIPAVGASPSDTYKAGSWDTPPSTETAITKDTTYTYTYETSMGCDSIIILQVDEAEYNSKSYNVSLCAEQYTWPSNGATYYETGIYYDTIHMSGACDSTLILNLELRPSYSIEERVTSCDSYRWKNDDYNVDMTFDESTVYTHHYINSYGCDSEVTLFLSINDHDETVLPIEEYCDEYFWDPMGHEIIETDHEA